MTHPNSDPSAINARWLWGWWQPQWDLRNAGSPACTVCLRTSLLLLLDRQLDPLRTIVFPEMVAICTPCAARVEQLIADRTARRWHGMPRPIAVDTILAELATGTTPIDPGAGEG